MAKRKIAGSRIRWADRKLIWLEQVARDPMVTDFGVRVALVIALHGDPGTGATCASQNELAGRCRATKGGIRKALRVLVERHHLTEPTRGTRRRAAMYTMDVHALRERDAARGRVRIATGDGATRVYLSGRDRVPDDAPSAPHRGTGVIPWKGRAMTKRLPAAQRLARIEAEARERRRQK